VLHNALFFGRKRVSGLVVPWTTYTDPEVAHVGLSAAEAQARGDTVATLTVPLSAIDRAVLESRTDGFARVHAERRSGRILGATMVASHAGDMIGEVALAMKAGVSLGVVGDTIHPYPTYAAAWKRLGDDWKRTRLTPGVQALLRTLLRWRR
jgi:pyruvate/2-oxoglutarate dehydrogenase complex dihydrolipoamide dehydrogenase (E3) component